MRRIVIKVGTSTLTRDEGPPVTLSFVVEFAKWK